MRRLRSSARRLKDLLPLTLWSPARSFAWREPVAVDILSEIAGVEFDVAWERRVEEVIDPETSLTAYFISRRDLLAAKLASGRAQDLADAEAIRKAEEGS